MKIVARWGENNNKYKETHILIMVDIILNENERIKLCSYVYEPSTANLAQAVYGRYKNEFQEHLEKAFGKARNILAILRDTNDSDIEFVFANN